MRALSDEQRMGIGLVGELLVRRWLHGLYPAPDIDECWKSGYKNLVLGRTDGDDSLGSDFEVDTGSVRRLYEVKTSVGGDWQFALPESKVRGAQRASADKRVRFRTVFVSRTLEPEHRRLWVLPNPFSSKGPERLRMVGAGMRFRFEPAEDVA